MHRADLRSFPLDIVLCDRLELPALRSKSFLDALGRNGVDALGDVTLQNVSPFMGVYELRASAQRSAARFALRVSVLENEAALAARRHHHSKAWTSIIPIDDTIFSFRLLRRCQNKTRRQFHLHGKCSGQRLVSAPWVGR